MVVSSPLVLSPGRVLPPRHAHVQHAAAHRGSLLCSLFNHASEFRFQGLRLVRPSLTKETRWRAGSYPSCGNIVMIAGIMLIGPTLVGLTLVGLTSVAEAVLR